MKSTLHLLVFLMISSSALTQTVFQVGSGTVITSGYPLLGPPANYTYSRASAIYTVDELNNVGIGLGDITSIGWDKYSEHVLDGILTIYFNHTGDDLYSGNVNWALAVSGATEVYSNTVSIGTSAGWIDFNFTNPFNWDGTSNVEVLVEFERTGVSGIGNIAFNGTTMQNDMSAFTANLNAFVTELVVNSVKRTNTRFTAMGLTTEIHDGLNAQFTLYPSPCSDILTISPTQHLDKRSSISIYNSMGVLTSKVEVINQTKQIPISTAGLNPGLYFIAIQTPDLRVLEPFVKK